jgi:hypothetical protein
MERNWLLFDFCYKKVITSLDIDTLLNAKTKQESTHKNWTGWSTYLGPLAGQQNKTGSRACVFPIFNNFP